MKRKFFTIARFPLRRGPFGARRVDDAQAGRADPLSLAAARRLLFDSVWMVAA
jgi:hypothetical protein